jgi:hypothetical protein
LAGIVIVVGFFIGFGSGLVENTPGFTGNPQDKYYGFPFVWRAVNTVTGQRYGYPLELLFDVFFGIGMVSIIIVAFSATQRWMTKKIKHRRGKVDVASVILASVS